MRIEEWPVCRTTEFLAAYRLDFAATETATVTVGAQANPQSRGVAAVWGLAGSISDARVMVLKTQERSWIAAGTVLVEGRLGLNIGLLMPSMREIPSLPAGAAPVPRHEAPLDRTLWALAMLLAGVEAPRTLAVDVGEVFRIDAGPDGFRLEAGRSVEDLCTACDETLQSGRRPRYTLVAEALTDPGPEHPVTSLLCGDHQGTDIILTESCWPIRVPSGVKIGDLGLAIALIQRMRAAGFDGDSRLQILNGSGSSLVSVSRVEMTWCASLPRRGV